MEKIKIITDSASDISFDNERKYDIDVMSFSTVIGDKIYTSRVDFDNEEFYRLLARHEDEIPKTSQITSFQFMETYYNYYKEGYTDLILVLINSQGSATYQNSLMAIDMLLEEHPECEGKINITCHDSRGYTGLYGHLVVKAAKMVKGGSLAEDINIYLKTEIPKRRIYFGIYSLKYAGKSGRIPSAAAFLGDKIGIKPMMKIWDHEITTAAKCRGDKKIIAKIVSQTVLEMAPGSDYEIVYGDDTKIRDDLIERMTKELGYGPVDCYQIGAEITANAGPTVVGTIFNIK